MKKHNVIFQKHGQISIPVYRKQFKAMLEDVKDGEFFQGVFFSPRKPKSNEQLGYLYSAVYPHFISHYKDTQGYVFQIQKGSSLVDVEPNAVSVDLYLKTLYCIKKSIKEFNKTNASTEDLADYINFLDEFSIQTFSYPIPEAKKQ